MPAIDIERQIEKYWENFRKQLNDEDAEKLDKILDEIEERFVDPTAESPVKAVDFAKWLNPEPILNVLRPSYSYFKYIKKRLSPRMRFFAYFTISKKKNLWQVYHSLSEKEFVKLGFDSKPNYEMLREFVYERIGIEQFPIILRWIVKELNFLLRAKRIELGKRTFQDATDTHSLKHDKESKYSGYYKHSGYKLDKTIDAETGVPLHYQTMEITEDEGKNLIPSQKNVKMCEMREEMRVVDDSYATFKNIAYSELHGISLYYKIAKNWVYKEEGKPGMIKKLYQKYHRCNDFAQGADLDFILHFLYRKDEYEAVGSYFRNLRMAEYEEHPEGYMDFCHERGGKMEGDIGRIKHTTILDDHPGRRGWKQFLLRAGMTMLSLVFTALIRVQNGIVEHLTNVTYIT